MKQETINKTKTTSPVVMDKAAKALVATEEQTFGIEGVDSKDILIPKLLVMQGLSKLVVEDKAQMGDFVDSVNGEILGSAREKAPKPVTIIPIKTFKTWIEYEKIDDKKLEFRGIVPMDETNANWPLEEVKDGRDMRRDRCINFYVLLKDKPDDLPYLMTFKRTSYRAGMKLATHFKKCELAALRGKPVPPAATMFDVTATKTSNDQGTFYVFDVVQKEATAPEHLKLAWEWFQMFRTASVKVDNSDLQADDSAVGSVEDDGRF